jgi:hypothetical protein
VDRARLYAGLKPAVDLARIGPRLSAGVSLCLYIDGTRYSEAFDLLGSGPIILEPTARGLECPLLALAWLLRVAAVILLERQIADASRLNALLNDPRVRPWIANGEHVIDVTPQVSNPTNVFLLGEHGAAMPALYEALTAVLPEYRGEWTNGQRRPTRARRRSDRGLGRGNARHGAGICAQGASLRPDWRRGQGIGAISVTSLKASLPP